MIYDELNIWFKLTFWIKLLNLKKNYWSDNQVYTTIIKIKSKPNPNTLVIKTM